MAMADASFSPRYVVVSQRFLDIAEDKRTVSSPGRIGEPSETYSRFSPRDIIVANPKGKLQNCDSFSESTMGVKGSDTDSDADASRESYDSNDFDVRFVSTSSGETTYSDSQQWTRCKADDAPSPSSKNGAMPLSGFLVEHLISMNARLLQQNKLLWKSKFGSQGASAAMEEATQAPSAPTTQARSKVKLANRVGAPRKDVPVDQRTTIMLRNLPNNVNRDMLKRLLDDNGFFGLYNFLYLPIDFQSGAALGYAFVNMLDAFDVQCFWSTFQGFSAWPIPSKKVCKVSWSDPHQGLPSQIELYRDSPVMHESVPDEYRPICLANGVRVPFPQPNKPPRAPRFRHSKSHNSQQRAQRIAG
eukprot:TRINITY_DN2273_c0_g2_i4.p1 TRINITY_DN2273_c0_g2~~TRINITY_DN2273_c0_g2_i4.p1  ORF type:complete len:359 (+),score=59.54 TRINITY_DN2273_c0_g2_i4:56-1132(+)